LLQYRREVTIWQPAVILYLCTYDGSLLAAVAIILVTFKYCVRSMPPLIVHGLMWANNAGFFLFWGCLLFGGSAVFLIFLFVLFTW
jgi:hypothetical protein